LHHGTPDGYASSDPSVAINNAGTIVVAHTDTYYAEAGQRGPIADAQVIVERWSTNATFLGEKEVLSATESRYSAYSASLEYNPSVSEDDAGHYVVTARQERYRPDFLNADDKLTSVTAVAQVFDAAGNTLTGYFDISSTADNPVLHTQNQPDVAMDAHGNFVVAFVDANAQGPALYARLFTLAGDGVTGYTTTPPVMTPPIVTPRVIHHVLMPHANPGDPYQIVMLSKQTAVHAHQTFSVRVRVLDVQGHVTRAGTLLQLRLASGHLGAGHITAKVDRHGYATFTGLSIAKAGSYTATVATPDLLTSASLRVTIRRV
jgi:hypothetical protein